MQSVIGIIETTIIELRAHTNGANAAVRVTGHYEAANTISSITFDVSNAEAQNLRVGQHLRIEITVTEGD